MSDRYSDINEGKESCASPSEKYERGRSVHDPLIHDSICITENPDYFSQPSLADTYPQNARNEPLPTPSRGALPAPDMPPTPGRGVMPATVPDRPKRHGSHNSQEAYMQATNADPALQNHDSYESKQREKSSKRNGDDRGDDRGGDHPDSRRHLVVRC